MVCGTNVTSYNPRAQATTSALTVLFSVLTTNSNVPSPASAASTVNVVAWPNNASVRPDTCTYINIKQIKKYLTKL